MVGKEGAIGVNLSDVPAILQAAGGNLLAWAALIALLVAVLVFTLFRSTDQAWLRILAVCLFVGSLAVIPNVVRSVAAAIQEPGSSSSTPGDPATAQVAPPLRLVVRGAPTEDIRVREALLLAVTWSTLPDVEEVAFGESLADWSKREPAADPERAALLMAEAGRPSGDARIEIRLAAAATEAAVATVQALAAEWSSIGTTSIHRGSGGTTATQTITVDAVSLR